MLPALVLCVGVPSFGTISFSNNTLTYSSTGDLSSTIDPSGLKDVTNSYGITKASFQALNPQIVAFDSAPAASQTLRYLVANYDATNTVTFTFPTDMYNYGSVTTKGRGAFSGTDARHAISTVPVQNGGFYDWFDASITCTGGRGVQSLGFCAAFRDDQAVAAGQVLFTLSDASTDTIDLPALGSAGNPEYVFIGYTAPTGKTITRVQASRTSLPGGGYVSIDDLSFVMEPDTTAPAAVSDLATGSPTASSITLTWTAPGDDGATGTAALYDVRYSTSAINAGNWDAATPVADEPTPAAAGTGQNMTVSGLSADTTYYFAMKTSDEVPNTSGLSNCPSGTTSDVTAPAAITDLATSSPTASSITLTWTAPGDSGSTGTAASYDIRCSTSTINEGNWASATQVTGEPTPAAAGTSQNLVVSGLSSGMTYYFAIKASDEVPNTSGISNCPSGTTATGGSSTIVALKRDSGLTAGGAIDERFDGASVRTVSVADAAIYIYGESRWMNGGASGGAGDYSFYKFDLSSIPANSTINLAQLRLYHTVGNGGAGDGGISMVLTHDWAEGAGSYSYPGATAGVSYAHPSGTNTGPSQNATGGGTAPLQTWGTGNDSFFDIGVDAGSSIAPSSAPIGQGYHVINVTSHVQQWVNATYPNYGWAQLKGYWDFHLSEAGTAAQPVLFIDYASSGGDSTAPAAVSNLATSSPTTSSLTLSWTAPGDDGSTGTASSYDIRYATSAIDAGNWASATQVVGEPTPAAAGSSHSMTVTGLTASTTYYFAIKTADEVPNTSAISNSPSGTTSTGDTTAPAAISNLATSNPTSGSITLTWTAPGDDNSTGTATTYDIRYRTGGAIDAGNWASATQVTGEPAPAAAGTNQSFLVNGLSPSTTYYFAIQTADEVPNTSGLSNSPSGQTTAPGASAQIALKRNSGLVAGGAIDARFASAAVVTTTVQDAQIYGVQQSRWYNGGTAAVTNGGSAGVSWVTYKFDLAAVPAYAHINLAQLRINGSGEIGTPSMAMILTHDWIEGTTNWAYPGAAGGITYWAPIGYNTDCWQNPSGGTNPPYGAWGPNSDSYLDMAIDGGSIVNPSSSSGGYWVYNVTADVQTWVRGGQPNFGWVQLDYSHFSLSESGSDTQPVLFIDYALEGDTTPPATIANLATSNVTNRSVTLSWTAPGDDGSTGTASSYEIRYATSPITATSWALATPLTGVPAPQAAGTGQSVVVDNLFGATTYYFAIKASDEVPNVTPLSNVVSAQTAADTVAPAAVSNLAAGSATNHSLTLTWTAPGDDGATTGAAASYDIRYSTSTINAGNWDAATQVAGEPAPVAGGTGQSMVIDNLDHNTTYYFAMKTSDEVPNTSGLSNVASGQVLADTTNPGAVTDLTVTKAKSSALRLAWIASGDDGTERTATGYDIRYRTGGAVTEGNWASCTQVTGEPAAVQPGYHRNMWINGLSASTTYYIGIKALDEAGNASPIAAASAATPAASNLTRPLLQPSDLEFLGAFKLPQWACGNSTASARAGLAVRRVNGNLQFLTCTHVYADGVYECNFPGWGASESTWPMATIIREWGMPVYGDPTCKSNGEWTHGLSYDPVTGRLYYSYGHIYYVSQVNVPSLGCAVLNGDGSVTVSGPWLSQNVHTQVMRGGSLIIPDWFANTYLDGRKLGVGFGGPWSGWASCSPGPALAAAHHPDDEDTELDTIRLLQYDHTWPDHWAKRDGGYWWRDGVPVYDAHLPDGDIGYWTPFDGCTGIWVDLPDKQGLLYLTSKAYEGQWYDDGSPDSERYENWWRVFDPADLAEVALGNMDTWEPAHDEWPVQSIPNPVNHAPIVLGLTFDAQSRTLFVLAAYAYQSGIESYPVVYGYHIAE